MKQDGDRFEVEGGDDREKVFHAALKEMGGPSVIILPEGKVYVVGQLTFTASAATLYEPQGNREVFDTGIVVDLLEREHGNDVKEEVGLHEMRTGIVGPFSPADLEATLGIINQNLGQILKQYGGQRVAEELRGLSGGGPEIPPQVQELLDALMNDEE